MGTTILISLLGLLSLASYASAARGAIHSPVNEFPHGK